MTEALATEALQLAALRHTAIAWGFASEPVHLIKGRVSGGLGTTFMTVCGLVAPLGGRAFFAGEVAMPWDRACTKCRQHWEKMNNGTA